MFRTVDFDTHLIQAARKTAAIHLLAHGGREDACAQQRSLHLTSALRLVQICLSEVDEQRMSPFRAGSVFLLVLFHSCSSDLMHVAKLSPTSEPEDEFPLKYLLTKRYHLIT